MAEVGVEEEMVGFLLHHFLLKGNGNKNLIQKQCIEAYYNFFSVLLHERDNLSHSKLLLIIYQQSNIQIAGCL